MGHIAITSKSIEFDAGHRVAEHGSKCRNLHGHRYKVCVDVEGVIKTSKGEDHGMVLDFGVLKELLTTYVHDVFDHGFIVHKDDHRLIDMFNEYGGDIRHDELLPWKIIEFPYVPTAENMALWVYLELQPKLSESGMAIKQVLVYETPTSMAAYTGGTT